MKLKKVMDIANTILNWIIILFIGVVMAMILLSALMIISHRFAAFFYKTFFTTSMRTDTINYMITSAEDHKNGYILDKRSDGSFSITVAMDSDGEIHSMKEYVDGELLAIIIEVYSDGRVYRSDCDRTKPYVKDKRKFAYLHLRYIYDNEKMKN